MAFFRTVLFLGVFGLTIFVIVSTLANEASPDAAAIFLSRMQEGDAGSVLTLFGENTCHCQPRGGFIAYLKYESGENDNLAYLFGHRFKTGNMTVKVVPTIEKIKHMSWEAPESTEVDVPVTFEKDTYSPYFIPLDTAYGYAVSEKNLTEFCKDPSKDFSQALTLRLRPSLEKGLVAEAPKKDPHREPQYMADLFKEVLPVEQARYLKPTDAAGVVAADGKEKPIADFANTLPRLKRGILRLYMGRRGKFQSWTVRKGRLKDPVFELSDGKELALTTPDSALVDLHGPAAPPPAASVPKEGGDAPSQPSK